MGEEPEGAQDGKDLLQPLWSTADVVRLLRCVPSNPDKTAYSEAEMHRRMDFMFESVPQAVAMRMRAHLEPYFRWVHNECARLVIRRKGQTVQAADCYHVLEPFKDALTFTCVEPPLGLLRHAKDAPASWTKETTSRGVKWVPSKERLLRLPDDASDEARKAFKQAEKANRAAETKANARIAAEYNRRVTEHYASKNKDVPEGALCGL